MKTETVLLNFIFWEILCHTECPTESIGFQARKMDADLAHDRPVSVVWAVQFNLWPKTVLFRLVTQILRQLP